MQARGFDPSSVDRIGRHNQMHAYPSRTIPKKSNRDHFMLSFPVAKLT